MYGFMYARHSSDDPLTTGQFFLNNTSERCHQQIQSADSPLVYNAGNV